MALKSKIERLERKITPKSKTREAVVAFKAKTKEEFEEKISEYLKSHPEPGLFVHIKQFGNSAKEG